MELGYGDVENLLMRSLSVPEDRRGTLRSRIQYLQRMGFPAVPRVGKGARARYASEHTLRLMIALELADLNWPAQTTVEFVDRHWDLLRTVAEKALRRGADDVSPSDHLVVIHPDALSFLRGPEQKPKVEAVSADVLALWAVGTTTPTSRGYVVVDVMRLATIARDALAGGFDDVAKR